MEEIENEFIKVVFAWNPTLNYEKLLKNHVVSQINVVYLMQ